MSREIIYQWFECLAMKEILRFELIGKTISVLWKLLDCNHGLIDNQQSWTHAIMYRNHDLMEKCQITGCQNYKMGPVHPGESDTETGRGSCGLR